MPVYKCAKLNHIQKPEACRNGIPRSGQLSSPYAEQNPLPLPDFITLTGKDDHFYTFDELLVMELDRGVLVQMLLRSKEMLICHADGLTEVTSVNCSRQFAHAALHFLISALIGANSHTMGRLKLGGAELLPLPAVNEERQTLMHKRLNLINQNLWENGS